MPRKPLHTLIWSQDQSRYELYKQRQLQQTFSPADTDSWLIWLETATTFAFQGASVRLNIYQEARGRSGQYWYAYRTTGKRTLKRYLGRTINVTFARLEEAALSLAHSPSPTPLLPNSRHRPEIPTQEMLPAMAPISTKLSPPLLPSPLVGRDRLLTRLDSALSYRLTLLAASAGWGKTTLLSAWATRSPFPLAWLSLDELDNDPTRFWVSVLSALRGCLPGVRETALLMLRSPQPPSLTALLVTLLNDLNGLTEPIILLLDDYHVIEDQTIHDSLLFVLDHLPAHLHLVLSSRVDPELALSRWRARGQLLELRDTDLRFEEDEVARFLTHTMNLSLSEREIAELARRTGGWIAGLQLAAFSLMHHPDRAAFVQGFTGSHRYVLDYVQEDILAHLETSLQNFVLFTSILNRMSGPLCQAVTTEPASQELLEAIERANLFLVPLDDERRWYRFHDLFRQALLARLHASQPELVPLLHQRAARWYEGQREFREAISHRLSAKDFSSAACLMEQAAEQFWLRGEAATMFHWVMALPDAVVCEHACLVLTVLLHMLFQAPTFYYGGEKVWRNVLIQVEQTLGWLEAILKREASHSFAAGEEELVHRRIHLLRVYSKIREAIWKNDLEGLRIINQQAQEFVEDEEIIFNLGALFITFALHIPPLGDGNLNVLVSAALPLKQKALERGDHFTALKVMQWLSHTSTFAGQFRQVQQECQVALALAKRVNGTFSSVPWFHYSLAFVCYRRNQLAEARAWLERVLCDARDWQHIEMLANAYELQTSIRLAEGELALAQQSLQELENFHHHQRLPSYHRLILTAIRVQLWLECGDLVQASVWAMQDADALHQLIGEKRALLSEEYQLLALLIRVSLAQQQPLQAMELLGRVIEKVSQEQQVEILASFLALQAATLFSLKETEQAGRVASRLLVLTEPEGYIRVYLEAGKPMKLVLKMLLHTSQDDEENTSPIHRSYISTLLAIFEEEEQKHASKRDASQPASSRMQEALPPILAHFPDSVSSASTPIEPLTPQEQRVLRLLADGRSNQEIARALVVSLNTVKTHMKNLYSKLHVRNRTQASALARDFHLL
jgi:LuxR family maltose regulon positive regulatory protein